MKLIVSLLVVAGCAHEYAYVPAAQTLSQVNGQTAALEAIPPDAPTGDVRVAAFGIHRLQLPGDGVVTALHLRMVIENRSPLSWMLDTREQLCDIAGEGRSRPIYAGGEDGTLPLATVAPGQSRAIDLFYPLPLGIDRPSRLPEFSFLWKIDTAGREVAMRTPFDRVAVDVVAYADDYYEPRWWGAYGFYDPAYFELRFIHPVPLPPLFAGPRIVGPPPPRILPRPPLRGPHPPVIVRPPRPRH